MLTQDNHYKPHIPVYRTTNIKTDGDLELMQTITKEVEELLRRAANKQCNVWELLVDVTKFSRQLSHYRNRAVTHAVDECLSDLQRELLLDDVIRDARTSVNEQDSLAVLNAYLDRALEIICMQRAASLIDSKLIV